MPNKCPMFRFLTNSVLIVVYLAVGIGMLTQKPVREYIVQYIATKASASKDSSPNASESLAKRGANAMFGEKQSPASRKQKETKPVVDHSTNDGTPKVKSNPFARR